MPISDKQQATRLMETLRTSFPLDVNSQHGRKVTLKKNENPNTKIKDTVNGKLGPKRAKENGNAFKDRIKGIFGKTPIESQKVKNLKDFHDKAVQIYKANRFYTNVGTMSGTRTIHLDDWKIKLSSHSMEYSLERKGEKYEGSMGIIHKIDQKTARELTEELRRALGN